MRLRDCSLSILTVLTLLSVSVPAQASRWYPVKTGRFWVYSSPGQGTFSATVEAGESFAGALVQPLRWDHGSREYLSRDETGRVFLHGVRFPDGSYVVLDPPLLRMDSELTVGHEWSTVTEAIQYSAGGKELGRESERLSYRVIAMGPVEVAAGSFDAAEVLVTDVRGVLARALFSADAGVSPRAPQDVPVDRAVQFVFRDTYAAGVGWILRTDEAGTSIVFELQDYGPTGVPVLNSTWGQLKAQFED